MRRSPISPLFLGGLVYFTRWVRTVVDANPRFDHHWCGRCTRDEGVDAYTEVLPRIACRPFGWSSCGDYRVRPEPCADSFCMLPGGECCGAIGWCNPGFICAGTGCCPVGFPIACSNGETCCAAGTQCLPRGGCG